MHHVPYLDASRPLGMHILKRNSSRGLGSAGAIGIQYCAPLSTGLMPQGIPRRVFGPAVKIVLGSATLEGFIITQFLPTSIDLYNGGSLNTYSLSARRTWSRLVIILQDRMH